jgi:energy-coupling factor transport system ATP-binding protein
VTALEPPVAAKSQSPRRTPLRFERVWHELRDGPAILRGVELAVHAGERVALMGRNGAGKSTLLRHAADLMRPTRGSVERAGRVALLLQNPNDYLIHDRVSAEGVPAETLARLGLDGLEDRHPRDLSGGERQRLALAIVLGDLSDPPAVLCLDEPTRGLDRGTKQDLAGLLASLPSALIVATHDPEFAATFAQRVVLLADGRVIAAGPPRELLAGGTYFATETARILGGAALLPDAGAAMLAGPAPREVPA